MSARTSSTSFLSPTKEAANLFKTMNGESFVKGSKNLRSKLRALAWWEAARYALFQGTIKQEWVTFVRAKKKSQPISDKQFFSILCCKDFPCRWGSLPEKVQLALVEAIGAPFERVARLLDSDEVSRIHHKFSGLSQTSGHPATIEHRESRFAILEIRQSASIDMVLKNLEDDLQAMGVARKVLKNGNDLNQIWLTIQGLRSLWLRSDGIEQTDRNKICFPARSQKSDCSELFKAEEYAHWLVDDIMWRAWCLVDPKKQCVD